MEQPKISHHHSHDFNIMKKMIMILEDYYSYFIGHPEIGSRSSGDAKLSISKINQQYIQVISSIEQEISDLRSHCCLAVTLEENLRIIRGQLRQTTELNIQPTKATAPKAPPSLPKTSSWSSKSAWFDKLGMLIKLLTMYEWKLNMKGVIWATEDKTTLDFIAKEIVDQSFEVWKLFLNSLG